MLADAFVNFLNMCLETDELDPPQLDLLTDIDVLLTIAKSIKGGICHSTYWYAKTNNEYMKDYDKNKELPHLQQCDVNNL